MKLNITKPTLLLDEERCRNNVRSMLTKARRNNIRLRPHFKTHQSAEVGEWLREEGVQYITVSSLFMAEYFAAAGWTDITVAFPVNLLEIDRINQLTTKCTLNLLVESVESVRGLGKGLEHSVQVFIKVNIGNNRTGVQPDAVENIEAIFRAIDSASNITFQGFLGHAGQSYQCRNGEGIAEVHQSSLAKMSALKEQYQDRFSDLEISVGDTPTCSLMDEFPGVDEIRPGNFVLYDLMQLEIGSCQEEQIAVAMACPIVAMHPDRNEVIVYGGGIHFSKDRLDGPVFGRVVAEHPTGWGKIIPEAYVRSLSQEHGVVKVPASMLAGLHIGAILKILPVHSCMAVDLMPFYQTTEGKIIPIIQGK